MQPFLIHPVLAAGTSLDITGIVAVAGAYSIPILIIGLSLFFRYRRRKLQHETLRMFIEKGQPIPPQLLAEPWQGLDYTPPPRNDLRRGLIWVAIGLALMLGNFHFGNVPGVPWLAFTGIGFRIGLIPLFIGIAFISSHLVQGKGATSGSPPPIPKPNTTTDTSNPSGPTPG